MEYGFSCMGYEIAGAHRHQDGRSPTRDVICMVGDGSYMMANSELATAVMMGVSFTVVLTDNRGYRLHQPAADGDRRGASSTTCSTTPGT